MIWEAMSKGLCRLNSFGVGEVFVEMIVRYRVYLLRIERTLVAIYRQSKNLVA